MQARARAGDRPCGMRSLRTTAPRVSPPMTNSVPFKTAFHYAADDVRDATHQPFGRFGAAQAGRRQRPGRANAPHPAFGRFPQGHSVPLSVRAKPLPRRRWNRGRHPGMGKQARARAVFLRGAQLAQGEIAGAAGDDQKGSARGSRLRGRLRQSKAIRQKSGKSRAAGKDDVASRQTGGDSRQVRVRGGIVTETEGG